jgi:hypothetical protein
MSPIVTRAAEQQQHGALAAVYWYLPIIVSLLTQVEIELGWDNWEIVSTAIYAGQNFICCSQFNMLLMSNGSNRNVL